MNTQPDLKDPGNQTASASQSAGGGKLSGPASKFAVHLNPALLVALAALLLLAWQWFDTGNQVAGLQQELARRLAEIESHNKESRVTASQSREASRQAEIKLGLLENKLAESQNQQVALEALYQELSRSRDESLLAEVEQMVFLASQQLQLAGNVKTALIALQNADTRLQRVDRPQLIPLRKLINKDMERLRALPHVDTAGMSLRLDNLISGVDALPLAMDARPGESRPRAGEKPEGESVWARLTREAWEDIRQLIRVQNVEKPEAPLLSPSQTFFLRENLRLRLLSARLALLARDEASFKTDLKAAHDWINRYYDRNANETANALAILRQLRESQVSIELPDISASLEALRNYKLSRERAAR